MAMNYFRGAAGALAVADLTVPETINRLHEFCEKFLSVNPRAALLTLGNKVDLFQSDDKIIFNLAETAHAFSSDYLLTSAKTGHQVEEAFGALSKIIGSGHG